MRLTTRERTHRQSNQETEEGIQSAEDKADHLDEAEDALEREKKSRVIKGSPRERAGPNSRSQGESSKRLQNEETKRDILFPSIPAKIEDKRMGGGTDLETRRKNWRKIKRDLRQFRRSLLRGGGEAKA